MKSLRFRVIGVSRSGQRSMAKYLSQRFHAKVENSEDYTRKNIGELNQYDRIILITISKGFIKSLKATNTTLEATSQKPCDIRKYIDGRFKFFSRELGGKLMWVELDEMIKNPNFPHMNKR